MAGQAHHFADGVVVLREQRRRVVLCTVHHARLQRRVELVETHRNAVSAHRVHGFDEQRIPHHADLHALQIRRRGDRLLRIDVARAGVHPAQRDQARARPVGHALEQILADRSVDHFAHVRLVAEDERQVEHVHLVDHRAHRADRDARDLQRAHLGLFDHFLLAAKLHRREHLDRDPAVRRGFELLAHAHDRLDRRVTERVHVGRFPHRLWLGECSTQAGGGEGTSGAGADQLTSFHRLSPRLAAGTTRPDPKWVD